jgi:hypothetical protein
MEDLVDLAEEGGGSRGGTVACSCSGGSQGGKPGIGWSCSHMLRWRGREVSTGAVAFAGGDRGVNTFASRPHAESVLNGPAKQGQGGCCSRSSRRESEKLLYGGEPVAAEGESRRQGSVDCHSQQGDGAKRHVGSIRSFSSPDRGYRFGLVDSSGTTRATSSGTFPTKRAVSAAIALVREIAGTGLVRDQSTGHSGEPLQPRFRPTQAAAIRNGSGKLPSAASRSRLAGRSSAPAHG